MKTRQTVSIAIVVLLLFATLPVCSGAVPRSDTEGRTVPAVAMKPAQTPQGGFSILEPLGWDLQRQPQSIFAINLKPQANTGESAYVILVNVSDLRYLMTLQRCNQQFARSRLFAPDSISGCVVPAVRAQMDDSRRRWAPADALRSTLQVFASAGAQFQLASTTQETNGVIGYRVLIRQGSQQLASNGTVTMAYFSNPLFSTTTAQGVTSLALISGCNAPISQEESFRATCSSILQSFRMDRQTMNEITSELLQSYQTEAQILIKMGQSDARGFASRSGAIANWGAQMQQMQNDTYGAIQAANYHNGLNWIATLGDKVNMQDPRTGKVYALPAGYGSYCMDASGNTALMGLDLKPGQSVSKSSAQCDTLLHSW